MLLHLPRRHARPTLDDYAQTWLARLQPTFRLRTAQCYAQVLRTLIGPDLAAVPLAALDRARVILWLGHLAERRLQPNTIHQALALLGQVCRDALEAGVLAADPTRGLAKAYRHRARARHVPDAAAMAVLLAAAERIVPRYAPLYAICAHAGLRLSEARGLQAGDVNLASRLLYVRRQLHTCGNRSDVPKGTSVRQIDLCASLLPIVTRCVAEARRDTPWLFASPGRRYPPSDNAYRRGLRRACAAAGQPPCGLHTLRHHFGSLLISRGVSTSYVQRAMGHATPTITVNLYGRHFTPMRPALFDEF